MKKIALFSFLLVAMLHSNGQELLATSGNQLSGSNVSLTYSVGELAIATNQGSNAMVTEGFNQSRLTLIPLSANVPVGQWKPSVYPNPTNAFINISLEEAGEYQVDILDLNGRRVQSQKLLAKNNEIDLRSLSDGPYQVLIQGKYSHQKHSYLLIKKQ